MTRVHTTVTYEALNNTMRTRRIINEKLPMMIDQVIDAAALTALIGQTGMGNINSELNEDGQVDGAADLLLQAQLIHVRKAGRTRANLCVLAPEY